MYCQPINTAIVSHKTDVEKLNSAAFSLLDKPIEQSQNNSNRLLRHSVSCTAAPILLYQSVGRINVQCSTAVGDRQTQQQQQQQHLEGHFNDRDREDTIVIEPYVQSEQHQHQTKRFSSRRHRTTTYDPSYISRAFAELTLNDRSLPGLNGGGLFSPTNVVDELLIKVSESANARKLVLRQCGQYEPLEFGEKYSRNILKYCRKIGEGVFGEVFLNKRADGRAVVLKIIPIEGTTEVNGEPQKKFDEILPEILIAKQLCNLRSDNEFMTSGFVEVINVHCVRGCYPEHLVDLWELYRDNYGSENDHPELFNDDQLYIVLELANSGQDLEAFKFKNAEQSYSVFVQTALSLAVAEKKYKFEHRDLHWGNILIAPTADKTVKFIVDGKELNVPSAGVKVTIIDYTLSRMSFDGCCLFNDLALDEDLFTTRGDYQFDIYRLMRTELHNCWNNYVPYTNVLWLHYVIDKMIDGVRYLSTKNRTHRAFMNELVIRRDLVLESKSAFDYALSFINPNTLSLN